jgi:hypothetical protein
VTVTGTGHIYHPPDSRVQLARLNAADKPGQHLWCVTAVWRVPDPRAYNSADGTTLLDMENMLAFGGLGCYKCEEPYNDELAAEPCTGEPA